MNEEKRKYLAAELATKIGLLAIEEGRAGTPEQEAIARNAIDSLLAPGDFYAAVAAWQAAANAALEAKAAYEDAYARALLASEAKNEKAREADAGLKVSALRAAADKAMVLQQARYHMMLFRRGPDHHPRLDRP